MTTTVLERQMVEYALEYAARGWAVFPCTWIIEDKYGRRCSCSKSIRVECSAESPSPGKHPLIGGGFTHASLDPDQIRAWWQSWPKANIGIATGAVSGIVVLDVDTAKGKTGDSTLAGLVAEHGPLPMTPIVRTGSGGFHYYFKHPGERFGSGRDKLGSGLDTRGDGGYVIAPPSSHITGNRYEWIEVADG